MKAKVWNVGTSVYSEKFKGKVITIQPGKFVVMSLYDATAFNGQYPGKNIEKMLKVERIPDEEKQQELFICNFCGDSFATVKELNAHLGGHRPDETQEESEVETGKKKGRPKKTETVDDSSSNSNVN